MRYIDVRMYDGLMLRMLPDRGLDISSAWYAGIPLAWHGRVGERPPLPVLHGDDWLTAFGGGLLTTCGMQNVGVASEGHGVHGNFSHGRATDVVWRRELRGEQYEVEVRGVVTEVDAFGAHLRCERRIRTTTGSGRVSVHDTVTNLGAHATSAPWLYHVNIGAPLWSAGARLAIQSVQRIARDDDAIPALASWSTPTFGPPDAPEMVLEHIFEEDSPRRACVTNERLGVQLTVEWDGSTLPRLHQWLHPARGVHALAIEPANCSVLGRGADRAAGRLPALQPGEERTTQLHIVVAPSTCDVKSPSPQP